MLGPGEPEGLPEFKSESELPEEQPRVFMICAPATRYYRVMTRSERMPELIDETI